MSRSFPIYRDDDDELLGYVGEATSGWVAQTIFGYTIERTTDEAAAERVVREQGLSYLMGVWQYYDRDDGDWFPCVLKEVQERQVTVVRTNTMGYQDPDDYKRVVLRQPTEQQLTKLQ